MALLCSKKTLIKAVIADDLKSVEEHLKSRLFKKEWLENNKSGNSALFLAAEAGKPEIVKLLLTAGADVNIKSAEGWYPLGIAASKGYLNTSKALLQASPDLVSRFQAMCQAIENGRTPVAKELIAANFDKVDKDVRRTSNGDSYLHMAARKGRAEILSLLIAAQMDVNQLNNEGDTPLRLAITCGHFNCVQNLLQVGTRTDLADMQGRMPLDLARDLKDKYIVRLLEKHLGIASSEPPATDESTESWAKMGADKIALVGVYPKANERLTEVFNFAAREKFVISESLSQPSGKDISPAVRFDDVEKGYLQKALDAFRQQGGKADDDFVFGRIQKQRPAQQKEMPS